jgi:hypothetical protein
MQNTLIPIQHTNAAIKRISDDWHAHAANGPMMQSADI